ncbi:MAG: hypothetical protein ACRCTQ_03335 [Brevinemataceae bacterium]
MKFKDNIHHLEEEIRENTDKLAESIKEKFGEAYHETAKLANKTYSSIYLYFQHMNKKSVLSFLLGFGGLAIGAGLIFVPGVGFILGLLVGIFLDDHNRKSIRDSLEKSNDYIVKTAEHLTHVIQKNWSTFNEAFHDDINKIEEHKEYVKKYAEDVEKHSKNIIEKFQDHK